MDAETFWFLVYLAGSLLTLVGGSLWCVYETDAFDDFNDGAMVTILVVCGALLSWLSVIFGLVCLGCISLRRHHVRSIDR
jgi:hypothetical protein